MRCDNWWHIWLHTTFAISQLSSNIFKCVHVSEQKHVRISTAVCVCYYKRANDIYIEIFVYRALAKVCFVPTWFISVYMVNACALKYCFKFGLSLAARRGFLYWALINFCCIVCFACARPLTLVLPLGTGITSQLRDVSNVLINQRSLKSIQLLWDRLGFPELCLKCFTYLS